MPYRPPPTPRPFRPAGFTLIEMIVAIAVLSLMIFLANRMFLDAQRVVSGGMQTSQIIAHARTISDQLLKDAREMHVYESGLGSNTPGFLVITQWSYPNVLFPPVDERGVDPSNWTADADADGVINEYNLGASPPLFDDGVRSDQIAFFRDAKGLESITPGNTDRYDSDARARHARVWIGHVWPAELDTALGGGSTAPGEVDSADASLNYNVASQLTLGRQALMLVENDPSTIYPDGTAGDAGGSGVYATVGTRVVDGRVVNGLFDVLDLNTFRPGGTAYPVYDDGGNVPANPDKRAMFRTPGWDETINVTTEEVSYYDRLLNLGIPDPTAANPKWRYDERLTNTQYATEALEWAFARRGGRLRASSFLPDNYANGIFTAEQVAQLHGSFVPHVAEFAVEFAADFVDDFAYDSNGNQIHEHNTAVPYPGDDGLPDGRPDLDENGNIKWYAANVLANSADKPYDRLRNGQSTIRPPIYAVPGRIARFDGTTRTFSNPFLHEISTLPGFSGAPGFAFVFAHSGDDPETDDTNRSMTTAPSGTPAPAFGIAPSEEKQYVEGAGKYWPYMIRYRYRLMDGKGEYRSTVSVVTGTGNPDNLIVREQPLAGRWFEQIVPVPRPVGIY